MTISEKMAMRRVLTGHYLYDIGCDHEAKTDTPVCACMGLAQKTHNSVGAAVEYWTEHLLAMLEVTGLPECAWVIEANGKYWTGSHVDERGFSVDVNEALRFARFQDAEKVKHWLLTPHAFALRSAEHIWIKP